MKTFMLHVYASDNILYEGECESLIIPTSEGLYGILANHNNVISAVIPGKMTYRLKGEKDRIAAVSSGMVKVENNDVLVLVDTAERPEDIDANRAKREADEAKEMMLQKRSIREYKSAEATLARALARLRVKNEFIK